MVVLIGNIISFEEVSSPEEVQNQLQSVLKRINKEGRNIISPYTITPGDEFQAAYNNFEGVFEHIWLIMYVMHPVKLRFSIGVGEIATQINQEQALGIDGTAFYNARNGIEQLKKDKGILLVRSGQEKYSKLINYTLALISDFIQKWEKKRFAVLYGLSRERKISEMADFLDITERSIYKNIRAGSLETIRDSVREISQIFGKSGEET